jgi:hypothetical protein
MKILTTIMFLYVLSFAKGSFVDTKNHLEWQDSPNVEKETKWVMATRYCKALNYLGHNDWRLPSIDELKTIIDIVQSPKANKKFQYGTTSAYWTGQEYKKDTLNAWAIYMQTAHLFWNDKCDTAYVRCVRDKY